MPVNALRYSWKGDKYYLEDKVLWIVFSRKCNTKNVNRIKVNSMMGILKIDILISLFEINS
jgi:predicted ATPase